MSVPLIWWTNQQDCRMIKAMFFRPKAGWSEDDGAPSWPSYIADEYSGRYGRSGRGRLWVAPGLPEVEVAPWPNTAVAKIIAEDYAGIVIKAEDLHHVAELPGLITTTRLEPVLHLQTWQPDVAEEAALPNSPADMIPDDAVIDRFVWIDRDAGIPSTFLARVTFRRPSGKTSQGLIVLGDPEETTVWGESWRERLDASIRRRA